MPTENTTATYETAFFASRKNRLVTDLCNIEVITLNKTIVDQLLAGNVGNRRIKKSNRAKFVLDLKNGNYQFTGQPIIRDTKGRLLDGRHRLLAIREAGYPELPIVLVTLKAASICKKLTYIATGYTTFPVMPDSYLQDVLRLYRKEIDAIAPLMKIHGFLGDMAAAACAVAKVTGCTDEIVNLIRRASTGNMLQLGTPAHTLFKIINCHQFDYRGTTRNAFHFAIVANALIAELNNEKYPTINKNIKKALNWINEMARDNQVFILPKKIDHAVTNAA